MNIYSFVIEKLASMQVPNHVWTLLSRLRQGGARALTPSQQATLKNTLARLDNTKQPLFKSYAKLPSQAAPRQYTGIGSGGPKGVSLQNNPDYFKNLAGYKRRIEDARYGAA
jgi:hypothetical protein